MLHCNMIRIMHPKMTIASLFAALQQKNFSAQWAAGLRCL
jgi:hypothetical protein